MKKVPEGVEEFVIWLQTLPEDHEITWISWHVSPDETGEGWAHGWVDIEVPEFQAWLPGFRGDETSMSWVITIVEPGDPDGIDGGGDGLTWCYPHDRQEDREKRQQRAWSATHLSACMTHWVGNNTDRPDLSFRWDREWSEQSTDDRLAEINKIRQEDMLQIGEVDGVRIHAAPGVLDHLLSLPDEERTELSAKILDTAGGIARTKNEEI